MIYIEKFSKSEHSDEFDFTQTKKSISLLKSNKRIKLFESNKTNKIYAVFFISPLVRRAIPQKKLKLSWLEKMNRIIVTLHYIFFPNALRFYQYVLKSKLVFPKN
jgi:uncharacterized protein YajQ (UPF0234 family)